MENEYQVLNHLQENEITTQRKISSKTGLSLGAVNLLLKKMTRKGLIKVETLNTRTMRYILTPQGLQEKASLTYSYIRQSYRQLLRINQALDELVDGYKLQIDGKPIIIFGPADEIREIITQRLHELDLNYETHTGLETLNNKAKYPAEEALIITWREEEEEVLDSSPSAVNIMKLL
jgi:DNA-binding MarR family transcriptional regulator